MPYLVPIMYLSGACLAGRKKASAESLDSALAENVAGL